MKVVLPTIFNQLEEKNKHILLGLNTDYKYNLYNYGCMFFDLLAAVRYYQKDETVDTFMQKLIRANGFVDGGLYVHDTLHKIWPDIREKWTNTPLPLTDSQLNEIKTALDAGYPVMVKIDYNPATIPIEEHYLNVVDYNQADENDMTGADPLGGKLIPMKAYFSWAKFGIRKIIEAYCIISGPVPDYGVIKEVKPFTPMSETPVTSNPQPQVIPPEQTPTPAMPEPSPTVQPEEKPTEPPVETAANAQSDVLASVVDYLEIDKKPEDTTFDDIRRRIAGLKSVATDYWNKKEAAEKQQAITQPTIQSLNDTIGNLKGELSRMLKAHKAEIEAIESTVQNPRNLKKQFDAIYYELKGKHDEYFSELVEKRSEVMLLKRDLREATETQDGETPVVQTQPAPVAASVFKTKTPAGSNIITSIVKNFKSFFRSDDL